MSSVNANHVDNVSPVARDRFPSPVARDRFPSPVARDRFPKSPHLMQPVAGDGANSDVNRVIVSLAACAVLLAANVCLAGAPAPQQEDTKTNKKPLVREIFVPAEQLDVLLEGQPERVLLSRTEYEQLLEKASKTPDSPPPLSATVLSAEWDISVENGQARIRGTLTAEVLADNELCAVPLEATGVQLLQATTDKKNVAIGRVGKGPLRWFVEGTGRHALVLDMTSPLETTAARQTLRFQLPAAPASVCRLTVPGDVEVKAGADVVRREVDTDAFVTRFELLLPRGPTTLEMTLNSHLRRLQQSLTVSSVLVAEVTEAYERLHGTIACNVLHRALDQFRFALPDGFEVTDVATPELARWQIAEEEGGRRVLEVHLREQTTGTVVLNISAVRAPIELGAWSFPRFEPLDALGQVAVIGLLAGERLRVERIAADELIRIDNAALRRALPDSVFQADPGSAAIRPIVCYYAPQTAYALSARVVRPEATVEASTHALLTLSDQQQHLRGQFVLTPRVEKLFTVDLSLPAEWHVERLHALDGSPLAHEEYEQADGSRRIHVRLPRGIEPGSSTVVGIEAVHTPDAWLTPWSERAASFPSLAVASASSNVGAIAVVAQDDLTVHPARRKGLLRLDETEKAKYGLAGIETDLLYRYQSPPYELGLTVKRTDPRVTARTFSSLVIEPEALSVRYEIAYQVEGARTRRLEFSLPESTPASLSIVGLDGLAIKEYHGELEGDVRRWQALLAEPMRGKLRLAVEFQQPLPDQQPKDWALPLVTADGVTYQSGLFSVEANAELEVDVATDARWVDVGELAESEYQPGRGLLGVYGFVGTPPAPTVDVHRRKPYAITPAVVERATLDTWISPHGKSVSRADFTLATKALYLAVQLPASSTLWSVVLDGEPLKPQRQLNKLLVSLPPKSDASRRRLRLVYEMPVDRLALSGRLRMPAPKLRLRNDVEADAQGALVPMADLAWSLHLPSGYRVTAADGSVATTVARPRPAVLTLAKGMGVVFLPACLLPASQPARECAKSVSDSADLTGGVEMECLIEESSPSTTLDTSEEMYYDSDDVVMDDPFGNGAADDGGPDPFDDIPEDAVIDELEVLDDSESMQKRLDGMRRRERQLGEGESGEGAEPAPERAMPQPVGDPTPADAPEEPLGVDGDMDGTVVIEEFAINGLVVTGSRGSRRMAVYGGTAGKAPPAVQQPVWTQTELEGLRSLAIDIDPGPHGATQTVAFQSLGVDPMLDVRLVRGPRWGIFGWAVFGGVLLAGIAMTRCRTGAKTRMITGVMIVGTLLVLLPGLHALADVANMAVFGAAALIPYFLLMGLGRWIVGVCGILGRRCLSRFCPTVISAILLLLLPSFLLAAEPPAPRTAESVAAQIAASVAGRNPGEAILVQVVPRPQPVAVPADAVLLPYDPESDKGIQGATRMLVPYAKYVELWNRAYPDDKIGKAKPPTDHALAGATYQATLEDDDQLRLRGTIELELFTDKPTEIPLALVGGVLTDVQVDDVPARLGVFEHRPLQQGKSQVVAPPVFVLHVEGKGRHRLTLSASMGLSRQGGWRRVEGRLPTAPAASLTLSVPQADTEVLLGDADARRKHRADKADARIETALGADGSLSLQWRPLVGEGTVDRTLVAKSSAVLDVQEDAVRMRWHLTLRFRHGERDQFQVGVPAGYLVESLDGPNVRGWQRTGTPEKPRIDVSLLKPATESESFTVVLWKNLSDEGGTEEVEHDVPKVEVPEAALHEGTLTVRRSERLELRVVETSGVERIDLPASAGADEATESAALPIKPFVAYHFGGWPFAVRLASSPVPLRTTADVRSLFYVAAHPRSLETHVTIRPENRPLHHIAVALPVGLDVEQVVASGEFEWSVVEGEDADKDDRSTLVVELASGMSEELVLLIIGSFAPETTAPGASSTIQLPRLEVLDAASQTCEIAVQADASFNVQPRDLVDCERSLRYDWVSPEKREATQLVLRSRAADYDGTLVMTRRPSRVDCDTLTNVRITDRAIEETIELEYTINGAGVRQLDFLLPAWLSDCRVQVPMLRRKTIEPVDKDDPASPLHVRLELQDEVTGEIRVSVTNDRLVSTDAGEAPIPINQTGRTRRRFVALESAGRDEVVVDEAEGLRLLSRKQPEWARLQTILGSGITRAYLVAPGETSPSLKFSSASRKAWKATGARIGLARTRLIVDEHGAYRAQQTYQIDNTTEQHLDIALPGGATLWTALVAGEAVKPTEVPDADREGLARIPLFKTAAGDLDYPIVLTYGGKMPDPGTWRSLTRPVEFPLIHARNIAVEVSQVELHLPESHRWFDFEGTMTPSSENDFNADLLSHRRKTKERLLEVTRFGSALEQVRAVTNLKELIRIESSYDSSSSDLPTGGWGNYSGRAGRGEKPPSSHQSQRLEGREQAEYTRNAVVIDEATRELGKQERTHQTSKERGGNRSQLEQRYSVQAPKVTLSNGQQATPNWDVEAIEQSDRGGEARDQTSEFNAQWFAKNSLDNPQEMGENLPMDGKAGGGSQGAAEQKQLQAGGQMLAGDKVQWESKTNAPRGQETHQFQLGGLSDQKTSRPGKADAAKAGELRSKSESRERDKEDAVERYRRQLSEGDRKDADTRRGVSEGLAEPDGLAEDVWGAVGREADPRDGEEEGGTADWLPAEPALATGLASLDVTLPERGLVYRFSTPQGDIAVSARAVSADRLDGLVDTGWILLVGAIAWLMFFVARKGGFRWLAGRRASNGLIVVGLIVFCIFPLFSILAILTGTGFHLRRSLESKL